MGGGGMLQRAPRGGRGMESHDQTLGGGVAGLLSCRLRAPPAQDTGDCSPTYRSASLYLRNSCWVWRAAMRSSAQCVHSRRGRRRASPRAPRVMHPASQRRASRQYYCAIPRGLGPGKASELGERSTARRAQSSLPPSGSMDEMSPCERSDSQYPSASGCGHTMQTALPYWWASDMTWMASSIVMPSLTCA